MNKSQLSQIKLASLEVLDAREKKIIQERVGPPTRTLQQVADTFGLSRERVRQIEDGAFEKLKPASS